MEIVSFKIAKKLKEKGFKEKCIAYYWEKINEHTPSFVVEDNMPEDGLNILDLLSNHNQAAWSPFIDAPTISQVLKWLREERKVVVSMNPYYGKFVNVHWWWDIRTPVYKVEICNNIKQEGFDSYELAALAGIEYVTDNLI